jgi:hypothetical protein
VISTSQRLNLSTSVDWLRDLVSLFSPRDAARWLVSPQPRFGGASAIQMIRAHRQKEVARVIYQLAAFV